MSNAFEKSMLFDLLVWLNNPNRPGVEAMPEELKSSIVSLYTAFDGMDKTIINTLWQQMQENV